MTGHSRSRRPPSLDLSLSSRGSSRSSSPEPETIDDRPRPGERIFPAGSCFKQPTLAEVLSDKAPPPHSLAAFMAYLSQNHCLETLEFTTDAGRYRKHYNSIACPKDRQSAPCPKECATVRKLWQKLLETYVVPNAPREVNLPCSIRDQILSVPNHRTPPPPEALEPAVKLVHELMEESVLVAFLRDCQHNSASVTTRWGSNASDESLYMRGSLDDRMLRSRHDSSPPSPVDYMSNSCPAVAPPRIPRTTSPFSAALGWHHSRQPSSHHPTSSWTSNASGDSMTMVEDSGSSTASWGSPMTPPTTPPACDIKPEKGWKRMTGLGRGLGWGKKKPESASYW